ncbi:MAG: hypothetical protein QF535_12330, partial [Anaerolineales bacterium]|nr:hypothetical protein [Anaerolineales bacterium]
DTCPEERNYGDSWECEGGVYPTYDLCVRRCNVAKSVDAAIITRTSVAGGGGEGPGNLVISNIEKVERNDDILQVKVFITNSGSELVQRNVGVSPSVFIPIKVKLTGPRTCGMDPLYDKFLYDVDQIQPNAISELTFNLINADNEPCVLVKGNYVITASINDEHDHIVEDESDNSDRITLNYQTQAEVHCSDKDTGFRPDDVKKYCDREGNLQLQILDNDECTNSYECESNLCFENKCVPGCNLPATGPAEQVFPVGFRSSNLYCPPSGEIITLKDVGSCSEHFECISYLCVKGECVVPSNLANANQDELKTVLCGLNLFASCPSS